MASVWVVRLKDGTTKYIAAEECKSADEAATRSGCKAGYTCFVNTVFTPPDMTAAEWIAQQKKTAAPTPTPTPTPTTPPATTGGTPTPTTTTPTTTTPTGTTNDSPVGKYTLVFAGGKTTTIEAGSYKEASKMASQWGIGVIDVKPVPADYTQEQVDEFQAYWAFTRTPKGQEYPQPQGMDDYFKDKEFYPEWVEQGYTSEQIRAYQTFLRYSRQFGGLTDWYPTSIEDWIANQDKANKQFAIWEQLEQTQLAEQEAIDQYALDPEEAARRREEAYAEGRYAAKERYGEAPEYQPAFAQWMGEQGQFSGALQEYVEREYPSLKSEFQATQPTLTGFPTREEARAEATRRESGWQAWLSERTPELEQEYWSQRPAERGERLYMQQPTMRAVNW